MLELDLKQILQIMNRNIVNLIDEGEITPDDNGDVDTIEFFGFSPKDVIGIHTHKTGVGDGVWFRLHDGRVVDSSGEACQSDIALYDTVEN